MQALLCACLLCIHALVKRTHCTNGPYVWDRSIHKEGIGSTFQHRKQSLILADAVRAPWIGTLVNAHDPPPRPNNCGWFGLCATDCNDTMLQRYKKSPSSSGLNFLNASTLYNQVAFRLDRLCSATPSVFKFGANTIIEVSEHHLHQDWNYCTFNARFRARFYHAQLTTYNRIPRHQHEFWIAVHFRAGRGLASLANETVAYVKAVPSARVFLISEGLQNEFEAFRAIVPTAEYMLGGSWKDALWVISQSNVVIGGTSSFFVLGAHLCTQCTVLTSANNPKFYAHPAEHANHDLKSFRANPN
jgi:hypothetical protein